MEFLNMAQMNKITGVIAMAGLLGGLAVAGIPALAQTAAPANPGRGMMEHGVPSGQTAMNPDMMQSMSKMMDGCNRMMESMNKDGARTPVAPTDKG